MHELLVKIELTKIAIRENPQKLQVEAGACTTAREEQNNSINPVKHVVGCGCWRSVA